MNRIGFTLAKRMCTNKITIPQTQEGNKLCLQGKFKLAQNCFQRAVQIMRFGKLDQVLDGGYVETVAKLTACQYLNKKHASANSHLQTIFQNPKISQLSVDIYKYLKFIHYSNSYSSLEPKQEKDSDSKFQQIEKQMRNVVKMLLNSQKKQNCKEFKYLPLIGNIAEMINDGVDNLEILVGLIQRRGKSQKTQQPQKFLLDASQSHVSSQLQILCFFAFLLSSKGPLKTADKVLVNNRVNEILKKYEQSRPGEVFKPLINVVISLMIQKHYMSAEGIIGYLKNQPFNLINFQESEDKKLINNLYRMLVTRANNKEFQQGSAKQQRFHLGRIVIQRIVKAPLLGHPISGLLC